MFCGEFVFFLGVDGGGAGTGGADGRVGKWSAGAIGCFGTDGSALIWPCRRL